MALVVDSLTGPLTTFFETPPEGFDNCAAEWARIMFDYSITLTPAVVPPLAAKEVLFSALESIFISGAASPGSSAATAFGMESAFLSFAISLGTGIIPPFTFTPANAPPGLIGFAGLLGLPYPATAEAAATGVGNAIHSWMLTGSAVNPAGPTTVPWT